MKKKKKSKNEAQLQMIETIGRLASRKRNQGKKLIFLFAFLEDTH